MFELLWYEKEDFGERTYRFFLFRDKDGLCLVCLDHHYAEQDALSAQRWYKKTLLNTDYRTDLTAKFPGRVRELAEANRWKKQGMPEELWEELQTKVVLESL